MATPKLVMQGPSIRTLVNQAIKDFMPIAGRRLYLTAVGKIGHQQLGWDALAPSTLRKQRKSLRRMGKKAPLKRNLLSGAENPLLDTGKMRHSIRHKETRNTTTLSADFPMVQHEQDMEVGHYRLPSPRSMKQSIDSLPARPVMGPALNESIDPITRDLESFIGSRI